MKRVLAAVLLLGVIALGSRAAAADQARLVPADGSGGNGPPPVRERVYLTLEQGLKETFPSAVRYERDVRVIEPAARQRIERKLGGPVADDTVLVHKALDATGRLVGYGVVSEEIGKYYPITFLVGVTPDLKVERVSVLVYRESHGGDIRRQRFLSQYRGKTAQSPLRVNQDIVNISGATLSVKSLNFGVRKVLALLTEFYGSAGRP